MLLAFQLQIEEFFLEISLGLTFISTSPLNNSADNRKLEWDHKCKAAKVLIKYADESVLWYLYLSDKNTQTKIRSC